MKSPGRLSLISTLGYCLVYLVKVRCPPHSGQGLRLGSCCCSFICFSLPSLKTSVAFVVLVHRGRYIHKLYKLLLVDG